MAYYLRKEKKKKGTYLQMYESHCSFLYRLQIWQPRKPYKPLKALTWLECP